MKLENLMLLAPGGPPHLVLIDLGVAETRQGARRKRGEGAMLGSKFAFEEGAFQSYKKFWLGTW